MERLWKSMRNGLSCLSENGAENLHTFFYFKTAKFLTIKKDTF